MLLARLLFYFVERMANSQSLQIACNPCDGTLSLVRAVSVQTACEIAIVAQDAVSGRIPFSPEQSVEGIAASVRLALLTKLSTVGRSVEAL